MTKQMHFKANTSEPTREQTIYVEGLLNPVDIVVDKWGIPHIRAGSLDDLFFAQGFNAARDRLWQIDLWRKRGLGLLAADFGPGYVAQDRASRLFLYRGDMTAEWAAYGPDAQSICDSFAKGINAYIDLIGDNQDWLPPEFRLLGTYPAKWQAEDVVRIRIHSWMKNALSEVTRANVMASASAEVDLFRQNLTPRKTPFVADGIDLHDIPMEVLDMFKLALAPVTFSEERLGASVEEIESWTKLTSLGEVVRIGQGEGSNNWVIAGSKTKSGRPILANDPHRAHAVPALRYLVHLSCPEFDGIGAGEPILPGIMAGHNGQIAFGLTLFFGTDEEDVYVYETPGNNRDQYRYGQGWEDMRVVEETISVKGAPNQTVVLKFTRHGPVIREDPNNRRAFAVKSIWFEPGAAPYAVSLSSMRARNYDEFCNALRPWSVPAVNMVFADAAGDIAWIASGCSPVRRNWDGLLPVPGDGRFEWDGFLTTEQLPRIHNPEKGYFATANEMNLPSSWPHDEKPIGYEWYEGSRATRIAEVFKNTTFHTVTSSCKLQTDIVSIPARRLSALLSRLTSPDAARQRALKILRGWDCALHPDSAAAALFEVWWSKHLRPALIAKMTFDPTSRALLAPGDPDSVLHELENPGNGSGTGSEDARDELILSTLVSAVSECSALMGADPSGWKWGNLHHGYFTHAVGAVDGGASGLNWDVGPVPVGGGDSTPMNTMYRFNDFRVVLGASVRLVIDVGGWDNCVCINAPGQSGDPRSKHYGDLVSAWSRGEYVPMLYSHEAVDKVAEMRMTLVPSPAS